MKTILFRSVLIFSSVVLFSFNTINIKKETKPTDPIKGGGSSTERVAHQCMPVIESPYGTCTQQCRDQYIFLGIVWYSTGWQTENVPCPASAL